MHGGTDSQVLCTGCCQAAILEVFLFWTLDLSAIVILSVIQIDSLTTYGLLFVLSFLVVLALVPVSVTLAQRLGAMDCPTGRKIHDTPTPRLGGVAIYVAVWVTILAGCVGDVYLRSGLPSIAGILAGSLLILVLGIYDDIHNASPLLKLCVQTVAAWIAVAMGIRFELASNPLAHGMRDYFDLGILALPLTLLWIVGLTNAMNLIDGLDGLAIGIALFASIALFLISIKQQAGIVTYFYVVLAGASPRHVCASFRRGFTTSRKLL